MNILVGVSGGIAVYKACSLVSYFSKEHDVRVIMTKNATKFVTPLTFATLSRHKVLTDTFEIEEDIIPHIYYPQDWADLFIVAPTTANLIGKVASGIADDMLTSCLVSTTVPVIFVPAMNTHMYNNPIVQDNMYRLKEYGFKFVEPDTGMLACGVEGEGKFPTVKKILDTVNEVVNSMQDEQEI